MSITITIPEEPKASNYWGDREPTDRQWAFLDAPEREVLFGGQVGGGKSEALLMGALQYVDVPGYAALILRRTYADLALPGALMDRAYEVLGPTAAHWSESTKTWSFPEGGTITFGYLETDKHKYRYQGSEFQYIAYDELTQFPEPSYTYLFSRLRRNVHIPVPLRMRAGSNPGGEGHQWVYERFIVGAADNAKRNRLFIPAGLYDNPYIDTEEYVGALSELDDITRKQLLEGLWITDPNRKAYLAEWWRGKNRFLADSRKYQSEVWGRWISWDTALKDEDNNDYSAGVVVEITKDYRLAVRHVWRDRVPFTDLTDQMMRLADQWNQDGKLQQVIIEDKVSGTSAYQTLTRVAPQWLSSKLVAFNPVKDKLSRAKQAAVWAKRNMVQLPHPSMELTWVQDFEQEIFNFPDTVHDDQTDAMTQAIIYLENYLSVGWHAQRAKFEEEMSSG